MAEDVAAPCTADGVLGLVDARDEHADPDQQRDHHEEKAAEQFDRAEDGGKFVERSDDPGAAFTLGFGGETLAADEGTFFAHQSFELASVAGVEAFLAALITALELSLSLTILFEMGGGAFGKTRS